MSKKKNTKIEKGNKKYLYILFSIICVFACICIFSVYKSNRWYVKVGNYSLNKSQYEMLKGMIIEDFLDSYGDIKNGDVTLPEYVAANLGEDTYNEYFESRADMEAYTILSSLNEIDFSGEVIEADYSNKLNNIIEKSNELGLDFETYLRYRYSKNIKEKDALELLEYDSIVNKYISKLSTEYITDEDFEKYYNKSNNSLDVVEAYVITLENTEENLELSNNFDVSSEEEFIEKAIELQGNDGFVKYYTKNECPESFSRFLFSKSMNGLSKSNDTSNIYLVWKHAFYIYNEPTVNAYIMMFTDGSASENLNNAEKVLDEFNSGDKSKESFIALSEKYAGSFGYLENIIEHDTYSGISDWLFNKSRVPGDVSIQAYDKSDIYLIYFDEYGLDAWKAIVLDDIKDEKFEDIQKEIRAMYEFKKRGG